MNHCLHCGQPIHDTRHPDKIFCNLDCYLAYRWHTVTCPCGKQFTTRKKKGSKYCSKECRYKYMPKSPVQHDKRKTVICANCGKPFETRAYRTTKYCSRACRYKAQRIEEAHITLICAVCGKSYTRIRFFIENRSSSCCSKACYSQLQSQRKRGANNHNYRGGTVLYRGPNWGSQRRKAVRRDNYTCQICGKQQKPRQRKVVDVHHITPYRNFAGDYVAANDLSNLITLCKKCHGKVEAGKLACPKRMF